MMMRHCCTLNTLTDRLRVSLHVLCDCGAFKCLSIINNKAYSRPNHSDERQKLPLMECKRLQMQTASLQAKIRHWPKHCFRELNYSLAAAQSATNTQFQEPAVSQMVRVYSS